MQSEINVIGYTDQISVEPGDRVRFMVSCKSPTYRADIVRLIHGDPHPDGPGRKEQVIDTPVNADYKGREQQIHTGSHVRVPDQASLRDLKSFTLKAWIWPTLPQAGWQGLLTKWDEAAQVGYGLFVGTEGELVACIGDGRENMTRISTRVPLHAFRWYFVAAVFDSENARLRVHQHALVPWASNDASVVVEEAVANGKLGQSNSPFLMAASWNGVRSENHYDGKIDSPEVFDHALSPDEIDMLRRDRGENLPKSPVASWDFSADISSAKVTDRSPNELHGQSVHFPARAVTGHNWCGDEGNWTQAPNQYGAIHFHRDDLEDAGWDVDFEMTVPNDLRSGIYAARLVTDRGEDRVPFFVRPKRGTTTAEIAFLAPTLTYLAYANEATLSVAEQRNVGQLFVPKIHSAIDQYVADNNMRSLYDRHLDGIGVNYATWRRPLTVRPEYYNRFRGYSHGLSGDLFLLDWLEVNDFAYDVITDHDLHEQGADLLRPYRVVITGEHPEYWTAPMLDALEAYETEGGRLMYVGGNGFCGVISLDPARPYIAELRRVHTNGMIWQAPAGEFHHSTTGELGGDWVSRNRSARKFAGVDCTSVGSDQAMPYRRQPGSFDPRAAFIFDGIADDEIIGDFGLQQGAAGGDEIDRLDFVMGSPPHALLLATASGFSDVYLYIPEDVLYDNTYPTEPSSASTTTAKAHPHVRADMVFYELPKGGAVFSTSSITWCGALSHNNYKNNVSKIMENVLRRFLEPKPF